MEHEVETGLRCVLAPNPSPMTFKGTNTYLIGTEEIIVIDPGPNMPNHLSNLLSAIGSAKVHAILVTHSHLDHSGLARPLAAATGAPVLAAGDSTFGRSAVMAGLAASGAVGGGEGIDQDFVPDGQLTPGAVVSAGDHQVDVIPTPGHMANHLSFAWNGAVFSGDLVMDWSTSLISPPDGDMGAFFASLDRLSARHDRIFYPGHGAPVADPAARLEALRKHRRAREAAILAALDAGPAIPADLVARIYTEIDAALMPMAERNVLAHLIDLSEKGIVDTARPLTPGNVFMQR
ncbi:MAG: MBL fold metallo-hydrolase [Pseudomonadota bacterium]